MTNPTDKELKAPVKNFMRIRLGYDMDIILPTKEATQLLAALEKAEKYTPGYGKEPLVTQLTTIDMHVDVISLENYLKFKMNHILGVNDVPSTSE